MDIFREIVRSGVDEGMPHQTKRSVMVANYISLILAVAIFLIWLVRLLFYSGQLADVQWQLGFVVFASPILLNRFGLNLLSRVFLCAAPVIFVWYSFVHNMLRLEQLEVSHYDGIRVYLLGLSFMPYLLFDRTRPLILILAILPSAFSIFFFDFILSSTGVGLIENNVVTGSDYELMWLRTTVSYLIISIGCFAFQGIMQYNDRLNQKLLERLRLNSVEIDKKNRELNELNSNLEKLVDQKTRSIRQQNNMLIKYSYTNAHKVRGPVARILGLIQLSRMKGAGIDYPFVFDQVESETKSIDEILHGISHELDQTVGGGHNL